MQKHVHSGFAMDTPSMLAARLGPRHALDCPRAGDEVDEAGAREYAIPRLLQRELMHAKHAKQHSTVNETATTCLSMSHGGQLYLSQLVFFQDAFFEQAGLNELLNGWRKVGSGALAVCT